MLGIARQLGLSRSTVARICAGAGLQRLARLEPPAAIQRYERAQPGELPQLDVKKLGRITRIGHRFTGELSYPTAGQEGSSCTWRSMTSRGSLMPSGFPMSKATGGPATHEQNRTQQEQSAETSQLGRPASTAPSSPCIENVSSGGENLVAVHRVLCQYPAEGCRDA
jgi:hypothetical protein